VGLDDVFGMIHSLDHRFYQRTTSYFIILDDVESDVVPLCDLKGLAKVVPGAALGLIEECVSLSTANVEKKLVSRACRLGGVMWPLPSPQNFRAKTGQVRLDPLVLSHPLVSRS
jgi:hypothetical protein